MGFHIVLYRWLPWSEVTLILVAAALPAHPAHAAKLQSHTLQAFEQYVRKTEDGRDARLRRQKFLWVDDSPKFLKDVREQKVAIAPVIGKGELHVQDGLIHDWIGVVFIPQVTVEQVLAAVQNYDNHKNTHKPEVLDSKLIGRNDNHYRIYLRVSKSKAMVTAVLNTEHEVHYSQIDKTRWQSRSYSTKIAQVKNPGEEDEKEMPPGDDSGYLWRLYSYWRFEERDGGVYVECEAISLTRDVPFGFSLIIVPIIRSLPRESLANTLRSTRNATVGRTSPSPGGGSRERQ